MRRAELVGRNLLVVEQSGTVELGEPGKTGIAGLMEPAVLGTVEPEGLGAIGTAGPLAYEVLGAAGLVDLVAAEDTGAAACHRQEQQARG